jgi:flavin reductase (DIM6/NTAB) family NADH-FMN oxidoreductase RutF
MPKTLVEPSPFLLPLPAVLVTSRDQKGKTNVLTVSWTGVACSDPPMLTLGIRPGRYSHDVIKSTGECVVNVPRADSVAVVDRAGGISGRGGVDKLAELALKTAPASKVKAPLLVDCPLNLECQVRQVIPLGAHDLFIVEIVATQVDQAALDESGRLRLDVLNPLGYCPTDNSYVSLAAVVGTYGFTHGDEIER